MEHHKQLPTDEFCAGCGLIESLWQAVPYCPAVSKSARLRREEFIKRLKARTKDNEAA